MIRVDLRRRFTALSYHDLELMFEFYTKFLAGKKPALEADIEHQKHKGVSADQVAEITTIYKQYVRRQSLLFLVI